MTLRLLTACLAIACATTAGAQTYGANPPTNYQPTPTAATPTPAPLQGALNASAQTASANTTPQTNNPFLNRVGRHGMAANPTTAIAGQGLGAPAGVSAQAGPPPSSHHINKPGGFVPPPPAQMTLNPGVNATVAIAYGHVNRLVTPFRNPQVKTNSTASITVEGPIVYVASTVDEPIGLFIHDAGHGERAISVTLIPEDVPPVSTSIILTGQPDVADFGTDTPVGMDNLSEDAPYVSHLVGVLKEVAKEHVPQGYSLEPVQAYLKMMPTCQMPGLRLTPRQAIVGHEFVIVVNVATNVSAAPVDVQEDGCGSRARAVAAWPRRTVDPNQSTELYVVVSRRDQNPDGSQVRPSLVGDND
jgi:conjugal transfer pilus assembly protein TraK